MVQSETLSGIAELAKGRTPPVESWNPPYCGEIDLSIARDGRWFHEGSPIGRIALVKLFASVLRRDPDGRHYLVTPVEKVGITVEDAPFLAVEMRREGSGTAQKLHFRTNLDDWATAGPEHPLRFAHDPNGGLKPYVRVRGGLDALFTRALAHDLVALATEAETAGARLGVWSDGAFFAIADAEVPA